MNVLIIIVCYCFRISQNNRVIFIYGVQFKAKFRYFGVWVAAREWSIYYILVCQGGIEVIKYHFYSWLGSICHIYYTWEVTCIYWSIEARDIDRNMEFEKYGPIRQVLYVLAYFVSSIKIRSHFILASLCKILFEYEGFWIRVIPPIRIIWKTAYAESLIPITIIF